MTLAVILLLAGLLLAFLEAMVPSLGILATLSGGCLVAAVYAAFQESATAGWAFVAAIGVSLPLILATGWRVFPRTRLGRRLILQQSLPPVEATEGPAPPGAKSPPAGARGVAWSDLRPSGLAEFDGIRYTVVTEGSHVPKGTGVLVATVLENQIVVRPDPSAPVPKSAERSKRLWRI